MGTVRLAVLLCWAAVACPAVNANAEPCEVDATTCGQCVRVRFCPKLIQLYRDYLAGRSAAQAIRTLRQATSKCTGEPGRPFVCCESPSSPPPTAPAPTVPLPGGEKLPQPGVCGSPSFGDRIIGGVNATVGQFPWMASIQYSTARNSTLSHGCAGTLITSRHVLTAAHCVTFLDTGYAPQQVILGELDFNTSPDCLAEFRCQCADPPASVGIEAIFPHPAYENIPELAYPNDIAIVKLDREVQFTDFILPICLLTDTALLDEPDSTDLTPNRTAFISGWGRSRNGGDLFTPLLQYAKLPVRSRSNCTKAYKLRTGLRRRICAGGGAGRIDTCRGDSGGPLMVAVRFGTLWYQTGVSSFGMRQCGTVAGYTRVFDYVDWIRDTIQQ